MIKKKDLSKEDIEIWEKYTKNPSDVFDKERNNKIYNRKERFKFDLHGFTLDEANKKVKRYSTCYGVFIVSYRWKVCLTDIICIVFGFFMTCYKIRFGGALGHLRGPSGPKT